MTDWATTKLGELAAPTSHALATGPFGSAISAKYFTASGVPVIRGSNLSTEVGIRLIDDGLVFLTPEKARTFTRSWARRGDLVFTCWGTVGQVGLVDERSGYDAYVVSNKQMKLTPDPTKANSLFLYYMLSSQEMVQAVRGQAIGAAVPGFNLGQLRELRVQVPPLEVQCTIASTLATIDDLIENNRRRVDVLEEMARAIYREWFVHFRYPGHQNATVVDSPLGPIPEGWEPTAASHALVINPRVKLDKSVAHPFITMGDLSERSMVCFPSDKKIGNSGSKFINGDTLFARITPCLENGKTGFVQCLKDGQPGRGSTEFIVLRGNTVGPAYTYCLARSEEFRTHAIQSMSGASGRQRVRNECFDSFLLAVPPPKVGRAFEQMAASLFETVQSLAVQAATLTAVRDLLLPKLVSGQIDLSSLGTEASIEDSVA